MKPAETLLVFSLKDVGAGNADRRVAAGAETLVAEALKSHFDMPAKGLLGVVRHALQSRIGDDHRRLGAALVVKRRNS